ncbi:hypothetical protein COLO4_06483 [Corchorus olitorius]|uniref:DUF7356 domain-containing protein n=1 Tax=Corchorus olitorius TaxID=93759 RepID=A0A1R3KMX5_9ROSI|nr:hypothetical protein COLO4_06483 [Corchorus olitorius]
MSCTSCAVDKDGLIRIAEQGVGFLTSSDVLIVIEELNWSFCGIWHGLLCENQTVGKDGYESSCKQQGGMRLGKPSSITLGGEEKVEKIFLACHLLALAIFLGSSELVVLVQNIGENPLKVSLSGLSDESKELSVSKHGSEKVNISLTVIKSSKLLLSAGKGDCELLVNPSVSEGNFIFNLPSYDTLVTPVNGAYFLIVTVVIFGGSWACCMCRRRRRHDGIPYQELEMGLPESMAADEAETAEGWDQGWDDDWDEDKAVKSPAARHVPNISANGLTARSSNRDGWENDWDD